MNPIRLFIERPIATTLLMLGILLFGIVGYFQLPVSDLPNVDFPTITVSASLPGANPETMASSVATPLEQQFSTIAGLDSMNSSSGLGSTSVTLQFDLSRDIDAAAQDVQAAISTALRKLPNDMPSPPSLRKVNPADAPVLYLSLSSDVLPLYTVNENADKMVAQRLSMVSGVAQVSVYGSQKYAVRIQLDPLALNARGIGIDEVASAIQQGNSNLPVGTVYADERSYTLKANGQLLDADAYRNLIITYRNGGPVYLNDIATVIDSVENIRSASWFNGKRAVVLAIQKQPGTNTLKVIQDIRAMLPVIENDLPPAVTLKTMFDRSVSIRHSIDDVQFTLLLTIALVIFVIYLFLGNFSATWISSLALPMAIIGTFAVMSLLGFSLNNLSLMALTLSVGFVIDDAIVVLENITRYIEMGESPMAAALKGTREITFTVLSMTLSLVAVFIPVLFMGGLLGRLFNEFAVTMAVAILVSGFVSLSLTPMLCSRFLKGHNEKPNALVRFSTQGFQLLYQIYEWTLKRTLQMKPLVLILFFLLCVLTAFSFAITPKGFIPTEDTGQIGGSTEAIQGISFEDMKAHQQEVAAIIQKHPAVETVMSSIDDSNAGRIFLTLKPPGEREKADRIIQDLRPQLAQVTGISTFLQVPPSIRLGGRLSKSLYQYTLQSPDTEKLYKATTELEQKLKLLPDLQDVTTDLQVKNPELNVTIDRDKASALGLTQQQIENALSSAFGTRQVSTIYAPTNDYQVILELAPEYQRDIEALDLVYIRSGNNVPIPISTVASVTSTLGPLNVNHQGQFPSTTISFNLPPGVALGDVVDDIQQTSQETLPNGVRAQFQGTAEVFQESLQGLGWLLLVAVLVIYIVLGMLYESYIHPITILSGLPPAGLGALVTLMLFGQELNIYGFLGLIMLIGIVKKNAIMMIDFALELQRGHKNNASEGGVTMPEEAIYQACLVRFRPIMMTTFAALMGTLPIAIGFGEGVESRRALGLAVFGGLLVSQILTLYITPVLYVYMDKLRSKFVTRKRHPVLEAV
ncbi:MAG: efflux RND transporter permease subunit [Vampirovibrionales bacterium]|nr:efflux RND transporter permease subunit [Vampirovibrionales bacterium]